MYNVYLLSYPWFCRNTKLNSLCFHWCSTYLTTFSLFFWKMWYSFVIFNAFIFFMSFLTFIFRNTKNSACSLNLSPFCCNCLILDAFLTQRSEPDWIILISLVVFSSEMQLRCGICCLRLLWVGIWVSTCLCTYTHTRASIHLHMQQYIRQNWNPISQNESQFPGCCVSHANGTTNNVNL